MRAAATLSSWERSERPYSPSGTANDPKLAVSTTSTPAAVPSSSQARTSRPPAHHEFWPVRSGLGAVQQGPDSVGSGGAPSLGSRAGCAHRLQDVSRAVEQVNVGDLQDLSSGAPEA